MSNVSASIFANNRQNVTSSWIRFCGAPQYDVAGSGRFGETTTSKGVQTIFVTIYIIDFNLGAKINSKNLNIINSI